MVKSSRQSKNEAQRVSHFTDGVGTKIEVKDVEDIQDRAIFLSDEIKPTNFDGYNREKAQVQDHFGNTAQYIKFVNASIKEKHKMIQNIHEKHKQFDDEIDSLRFNQPRPKERLDQMKYREIKALDIIDTLQHLEKERDEIKHKKEHLQKQFNNSETELIKKDKQISEVKAELEYWKEKEISKIQSESPTNNAADQIQNELKKLTEKKDKEDIVKVLTTLVNQLGLKNEDIINAVRTAKKEIVQSGA